MLIPVPDGVDPVSIASLSDNVPDGWRGVGPYRSTLAALVAVDRRVLVIDGLSIGLYAAAFSVAYGAHVDTDEQRLAAAEKLGAGYTTDRSRTVAGSVPGRCTPAVCSS
jgi:threonine dehydrogenase-like Zn-dependent dehydrogenase